MRILALDTGSSCGWAVGSDTPEQWGTQVFDLPDRAAQWWHFHGWLADMIYAHRPTHLAYELPFHRGPGSTVLLGYTAFIEALAYGNDLMICPVHNATLKAHAKVKHGKLTEAARACGWHVLDDHQADACMLLDYITRSAEKPAA